MEKYDLLPDQQQLLMEFVGVYREHKLKEFWELRHSHFSGVAFPNERGSMTVQIPCSNNDLLHFEALGLMTLTRGGSKAEIRGQIRNSAIDAVDQDFTRPSPSPTVAQVQNFFAPIGAVHMGHGNITIETQSVGMTADEVASVLQAMDTHVRNLPPAAQAEVAELIADLRHEASQPVPKQSRLKAYLSSIWIHAKDVTEFAANVSTLATAYGFPLVS